MNMIEILKKKGHQLLLYLIINQQIDFNCRWISDPFIDKLRSELESKESEKEAEKAKSAAKMEAKAQKKKELLLKSLREDEDQDLFITPVSPIYLQLTDVFNFRQKQIQKHLVSQFFC